MYKNLSKVYDKLMDVDYATYISFIEDNIIKKENFKILDIGCGSGTITKFLASYGEVTAIDSSLEMLAQAKSKCPDVMFLNLDIIEIDKIPDKFDLITSNFDVLNYLDDFSQLKETFLKIYNLLNEGGMAIFDLHTPEKIRYMLKEQPFVYDSDEISYMWFTYETENDLEVESEISFFVKNKDGMYSKLEELQKQRTYEVADILKSLEEIGFSSIDYHCDFDINNKNYDDSFRIIFKLTK